jgi:hypothetical protein
LPPIPLSETANWPPGLSTLNVNASPRAFSVEAEGLMTLSLIYDRRVVVRQRENLHLPREELGVRNAGLVLVLAGQLQHLSSVMSGP